MNTKTEIESSILIAENDEKDQGIILYETIKAITDICKSQGVDTIVAKEGSVPCYAKFEKSDADKGVTKIHEIEITGVAGYERDASTTVLVKNQVVEERPGRRNKCVVYGLEKRKNGKEEKAEFPLEMVVDLAPVLKFVADAIS